MAPIRKGSKQVVKRYRGNRPIIATTRGTKLLWSPPSLYKPAPTNGTGGAATNAKAIPFASGAVNSVYHREAAHLTGSGPHPLVIHLHGDGYEEYTQYNSGTVDSVASKYAQVARDSEALFILPRTPDTTNETWWSKNNSTTWLVALIKDIKAKYNVDERRIFISGYSGGAEEVSYNLACDYHTLFKGGGSVMLGGGGAEGLTGFTGTPAADVKSDFLMRWWYGETDNGVLPSDTTIDAISASAEGEAWYKARGFNTQRTMIPGTNHYTSEPYGPDLLRQLIAESNAKYGIATEPEWTEPEPTALPETEARRFVVLGDSHSDYTPPSDRGTWWWRVAADTAGLIEIDNFAVRGWATHHVLEGFEGKPPQITQAEASPGDLAIVMLGGNDLVFENTPEQYKANLTTITTRLQAAGKRVVIVFPPPLFTQLNTQYGKTYRAFRRAAKEVASGNGAYYTDAWASMEQSDGTVSTEYDSGDTVHLNDLGQTALGNAVASDLQKFAGVTDPWGGDPRELEWTVPEKQYITGSGTISIEAAPEGVTPFRTPTVARLRGGTGDTALNASTGATPGERIRVEYPYQVVVASPTWDDSGLQDGLLAWPNPEQIHAPGSRRTLGQGVRRYEVVVPPGTEGALPMAGLYDTKGDMQVLIGDARMSVLTDAGEVYRVVTNDIW